MPSQSGDVQITIVDGAIGAVSVPPSSVQGVIGCSSKGTPGVLVSTRSIDTLTSTFGYGPLVEAAALVIQAGGTALAVKASTTTSGVAGSVTNGAGNTSTSTVGVTGNPFDDYEVRIDVIQGGTIGTGPVRLAFSLDNDRNQGASVNIGTATSYAIPNTGMTITFGVGALVTGDSFTFRTTGPLWTFGDVQAAVAVLAASNQTWAGGVHVTGVMTGAQATSLETTMEGLATNNFRFTFAIVDSRDFATSDVTEAAWMTAVENDFASVSALRVSAGAGYSNVQSPIRNPVCGAPSYRRCDSWPAAQRVVLVPIHVHLGRVKDGALLGTTGPGTASLANDGFIYHDERVNPGLDAARLMSVRTIVNRPGVYIKNPNILAPPGSDFSQIHFRRVMDTACTVAHDTMEDFINDNVRLNADGTILEKDAQHIEAITRRALFSALVAPGSATSAAVVVDRTQDIQSTSILKVTIRVFALGYLLEIDINIGFQSAEAA